MRLSSIAHVGPALVVIHELEAPSRLLFRHEGPAEARALGAWIFADELRTASFVTAKLAAAAGAERVESWEDALGATGGTFEQLLAEGDDRRRL